MNISPISDLQPTTGTRRVARLAPEQRRSFLDQILLRCTEHAGPDSGCVVLQSDGLVVASQVASGVDTELAAAHCAMVWDQTLRLASDGLGGDLDVIGITLENQQVWIRLVRGELLVALWLPALPNLGNCLLALDYAAGELQTWLGPEARQRRRAAAKGGTWSR